MLVKKLLALTLCFVTKADKIDDALNGLANKANGLKNTAEGYKRSHGGARNDLATEAAHDFYNRARAKTWTARPDLLNALWGDYKHHEHWEGRFRNWGGHRNGYAEYVHREAKNAFYNTHRSVDDMMSNLAYQPTVRLNLIFSNQGGSGGFYKKKVITGSKQASSINKKLASSITAGVKGPLGALTGSLSATASAELSTSFSSSSFEYKEEELNIDLSKPMYIYQVVGNFMTKGGEALTINGNYRILSAPAQQKSAPSGPIKAGTYYLKNFFMNRDSLVCQAHSETPFICCGAGPYYADQHWKLTPVGGNGYIITNSANNRVLGVDNGKLVARPGLSDVWQISQTANSLKSDGAYEIKHSSNMNLVSWTWGTGLTPPAHYTDQHWLIVAV